MNLRGCGMRSGGALQMHENGLTGWSRAATGLRGSCGAEHRPASIEIYAQLTEMTLEQTRHPLNRCYSTNNLTRIKRRACPAMMPIEVTSALCTHLSIAAAAAAPADAPAGCENSRSAGSAAAFCHAVNQCTAALYAANDEQILQGHSSLQRHGWCSPPAAARPRRVRRAEPPCWPPVLLGCLC